MKRLAKRFLLLLQWWFQLPACLVLTGACVYYQEATLALAFAMVTGGFAVLAYLDWADFMEEWNVI